jgi:osmotically-inducible protein OsmY
MMLSREQVQLDVVDELAYDPAVDSSRVAVTVAADGVVTLKGSVPDFMQVRAAERATKRVHGVRAVANDLQVNPPSQYALDDGAVAASALQALNWSVSVPKNAVTLTVSRGWLTLEGTVDWDYQRRAAYNAVRALRGVRGVSNLVAIKAVAQPGEIKEKIASAFRRNAQLDAQTIAVETSGGRVTLRGTVASWTEREAAEHAAFAAPGVTSIDNRIEVRAPAYAL